MTYTAPNMIHIDTFTVTGLSVRTINSDEFNQTTAKLPALWEQFMSTGVAGKLSSSNPLVYGVYSDYDTDASGFYTVTAGMKTRSAPSTLEYSSVEVLAGDYLVFEGQGGMAQAVIETWENIWRYFETGGKYKRNFMSDFELYRGPDDIAIYIGIKPIN